MATPMNATHVLHHRNGEAVSRRALAGLCTRYHVAQLSVLPFNQPDFGRTDDAQPMLVEFASGRLPGKFTFLYMAIELTSMIGRRVDLQAAVPVASGEQVKSRGEVVFSLQRMPD